MDERTAVLVGTAAVSQRFDDPTDAVEATALMRRALDAALDDTDAGAATHLNDRIDEIIVPEGIWGYRNPGRLVLDGRSPAARTVVADIGITQQHVFSRAANLIADGQADVVVIAAGEAKYRSLRARILGTTAPETPSTDEPDVRLHPHDEVLTHLEIHRCLAAPTHQYAVMESAIRHDAGRSVDEHALHVAELVSSFSAVAATNSDAWTRTPMTAADITAAPMVAEPYTKPCCSQWNVDQASAFVLCSVGFARTASIATDRWVFPWAGSESNLMVPLTERAELHRSPAIAAVGAALADTTGIHLNDIELLEIYSCFPAAVQMQCRELGIDPASRPLTVTGGMHFAGGPLNSFSLQALVRIVPMLRAEPSATALVTSVSGMVTKFGAGIWSATPPPTPFANVDVTETARTTTDTRTIDPDYAGSATVAGYTVGHRSGAPVETVVIVDTPTGTRAVAASTNPDVVEALRNDEWCGRTVTVGGATLLGGA